MPSNKKKTKTKRQTSKSAKAKKKSTTKKKPGKPTRLKRSPKKKTAKKAASSARGRAEKRKSVSAEREIKQEIRGRRPAASSVSGRQSGDLQGLSRIEQADSESVEELVEEGNISEAGAVAGVEESDNAEEKEVRTRELPEDDVPEEYLDEE